MTKRRLTPDALRFLLLGALGAGFWACSGKTDDCTEGTCVDGSDDLGDGGSGSDGSTGGTGGGPASSSACTNPEPILGEGADVGIYRCEEGYLHREVAKTCPSALPRPGTVEWPAAGLGGEGGQGGAPAYTTSTDECSSDADCGEHGMCFLGQTNAPFFSECSFGPPPPQPDVPDYARTCSFGCRQDSDCDADQICVCGSEIGSCWTVSPVAGCQEDADCEDGYLCLSNARTSDFGESQFACQLPGDECSVDADCEEEGAYPQDFCQMTETGRTCSGGSVCGRPFLIEEEARKAAAIASPAWLVSAVELRLADVQVPADTALRAQLAAHWTEIGLMEHASVAAFARFTLQLLALGAPVELVDASQRAALDEVRHAELAFALASRYAGRSIGPGPLPLSGALDASSVDAILRTTVREGCVGETRAALEASRAAETCEDPAVRSVLETIAGDEARHAELAWKVVRFIVSAHPDMVTVLAEEFGRVDREERALAAVDDASDDRFGVLSAGALERCHREAYRDVIAPCARTLLALAAGA